MKSPKKKFFIYELQYPDGTPFYIGKGKEGRLKSFKRNRYVMNVIRKIRKTGQEPIRVVVYETNDEQKAFHEEVRLIKKYGRQNNGTGILCNMTDGGEGTTGHYGDLRRQWLITQRKKNPGFKGEEEWKEIMDIARGNFQEFIWEKQREEIEQIEAREFEKFVLKHPELHDTYWGTHGFDYEQI